MKSNQGCQVSKTKIGQLANQNKTNSANWHPTPFYCIFINKYFQNPKNLGKKKIFSQKKVSKMSFFLEFCSL